MVFDSSIPQLQPELPRCIVELLAEKPSSTGGCGGWLKACDLFLWLRTGCMLLRL